MIILIILIILVLLSFNLFRNLFKNETILDDVKLKEEDASNNGFALMLEQEDGTYEESNSSSWPTGMVFNSELSGCIDVNGNKIDNSLSFDTTNNLVNVSVGETAYCYVYFDNFCKEGETLSNCIAKNSNKGVEEIWNSTLEDDGYRYVGTNPSNYICFGTTDKNSCIKDTDKYMYRIIGVFEDENGNKHTKLIKKEALNTAYAWHSDETVDVDWNKSELYNGLNGSYFLSNESYPYMQESSWTDKIAIWNYTMTNTLTYTSGGPYYFYETGKRIYLHELNRNGKASESCNGLNGELVNCNIGEWKPLSTKISLMYASDFSLSLGSNALNVQNSDNVNFLKTGWMHIGNNDSDAPSSNEWTMSRWGKYWTAYSAWYVLNALEGNKNVSYAYAVRPVFYLTSDVEYSSGTGTISDPFILKN